MQHYEQNTAVEAVTSTSIPTFWFIITVDL